MPISSWYCKLKNMSKPRNQLPIHIKIPTSSSPQHPNIASPSQRKSYCFSTKDLNNSPTKTRRISDKESPRKLSRKWSRRRMRRRSRSICSRNVIRSPNNHKPRKSRVSMSVISAGCICRAAVESIWIKPTVKHRIPPLDSDCETCSSDNNEYASNLSEYGSNHTPGGGCTFDAMLSAAFACSSASSTKCKADDNDNKQGRQVFPDEYEYEYGGGSETERNKSSGSCFAVVKSSRDPRGEFMQSMVEMIVENDLRGSKDLEELLVCYLSLNSEEYHNLIISVFKQIWVDLVVHLRRHI